MFWDYSTLYLKADEFEKRLPELIEQGNWEGIKDMLSTMLVSIEGATAESFRKAIDGSYRDKDVDCVLKFPEVIRAACRQMQERDAANAEGMRNAFLGL